jgi:hypothetical protein
MTEEKSQTVNNLPLPEALQQQYVLLAQEEAEKCILVDQCAKQISRGRNDKIR